MREGNGWGMDCKECEKQIPAFIADELDDKELKHFGRKARLITALELTILGVLWYAELTPYAYAVYVSICITAGFMIIGKIQLYLQAHME